MNELLWSSKWWWLVNVAILSFHLLSGEVRQPPGSEVPLLNGQTPASWRVVTPADTFISGVLLPDPPDSPRLFDVAVYEMKNSFASVFNKMDLQLRRLGYQVSRWEDSDHVLWADWHQASKPPITLRTGRAGDSVTGFMHSVPSEDGYVTVMTSAKMEPTMLNRIRYVAQKQTMPFIYP